MKNIVYIVQNVDDTAEVVHKPDDIQVVVVDFHALEARLDHIGQLLRHREYARAGRETVALAQDLRGYQLYAQQVGLKEQESELCNMLMNLEDLWRDENVG